MASFPTSVVALTNPNSGDANTSPSHAAQHANANDEIEAIEDFLINSAELDYAQITANTNVTATTGATANTMITGAAVSYNGSTTIMIEVYSPHIFPDSGAVGRSLSIILYDGASQLGRFAVAETQVVGVSIDFPLFASRRLTPTNASHTYSIRAYVSGGTGIFGAGTGASGADMPAFMRIIRVL